MSDIEEDAFGGEVEIEPEPVPASHLIKIPCVGCGRSTLAVREHLHDARCGPCLSAHVGVSGGEIGPVGPVPARFVSEAPSGGGAEYWTKDQKTGVWSKVMPPTARHPEPEVHGVWFRFGTPVDYGLLPDPVLRLAELAREASWEVRVCYARGNGVHGTTGRPTGVRHVIAIAFGRHPLADAQGVCTYVKPASGGSWTWESVWLWGPELKHFGLCSQAELKHWLKEGAQVEPEWYGEVRARVRGAENLKAQASERSKLIKALHREGVCVEELARYFELEEAAVRKLVTPARAKKDHAD